jgi:hypothetical protein
MALRAEPTPGSITRSLLVISDGSLLTTLVDADVRKRRAHRAGVAGAVVDDDDVAHNEPFVERTSVPSRVRAWASARPTALKAASATWCEFSPFAVTCNVILAFCARDWNA